MDDYAAFRLEDPIPKDTIPLYDSMTGNPKLDAEGNQKYIDKDIDTVIAKPGDFLYGDYDGAKDKDGNFYKVTAKSPYYSVSFKILKGEIKFSSIIEKKKNDAGDYYKKHIDKDEKLTSWRRMG